MLTCDGVLLFISLKFLNFYFHYDNYCIDITHANIFFKVCYF